MPTIILDEGRHEEATQVLGAGLTQHNLDQAGYTDHRKLAVLVTDGEGGPVLGGISGRTSLGLLLIDLVYLPPGLRRDGLGSQLLAMAEAEGRARGCKRGVLFTISFQAPGFYERHGWTRFGEVPCDPPGTSRI